MSEKVITCQSCKGQAWKIFTHHIECVHCGSKSQLKEFDTTTTDGLASVTFTSKHSC